MGETTGNTPKPNPSVIVGKEKSVLIKAFVYENAKTEGEVKGRFSVPNPKDDEKNSLHWLQDTKEVNAFLSAWGIPALPLDRRGENDIKTANQALAKIKNSKIDLFVGLRPST